MIILPHLVAQLDRCTVQVCSEDGFVGSGVFAAPGVVLTCAHVVLAAESACKVIWQGQLFAIDGRPELFPQPVSGSGDWYPFPDLAVLRLAEPPSHPCARLGTENPPIGSQVYASGFSTQTLTGGAAPDGLLVQVAAQSGEFLRVKHDQIYGGLSGSPVLDVATDRVCGLVKATKDESDERGGWIIPATAFPRYLQPVLEENRAYHRTGPTWDLVLPPQALPVAFRNLFKAQRKAAEEMPYQLAGAPRVDLANIYVRQQLGQRAKDSERDKDSDRKKDSGRNMRAESATRPEDMAGSGVVRDLDAALTLHHDLLVTGGPGAGKSTLTLQLAGDLAWAWLYRDASAPLPVGHPGSQVARPLVPLRVSARSLVAHRDLGWLRALAAAVTAELHLATELTAEMISTPVAGALWLILVDALDEIVDMNAYRDLLDMLADCMAQDQVFPHRLLITSRALADGDINRLSSGGGAVYTLVPFDERTLRLFAQRWFAREGRKDEEHLAERFLAQVRDVRLTEVVTIPLLATVAAIVFEQHPDQLLPAHRYQLYQKYLEYLLGGRDQAFVEQWPRLERQLTALPRGRKLADALRDERLGLVQQLAVKWVESGSRLAKEAAAWVKEKAAEAGVPLDLKPLNSLETALTVAMTTGLFLREGDDIYFLHQSFAEHLAARVYAEQLPRPFSPREQNWREWVDRAAVHDMPSLAHTVLTHYTCTYQVEEMIAWLQRQAVPSYKLVAGELIAYGAAPTADAVTFFCSAFCEWARWPDSRFSWHIFSRSAVALAALLDHASAASALVQVATDELVTMQRRITAAEVLAKAGHPYTENGVAVLRHVSADRYADPVDRVRAARSLAGMDLQYRDQAATALRSIIADLSTSAYDRRQAAESAESLAGLDPQYRDEAATALRSMIADPSTSESDRRQAIKSLAGLGPQYRDEAATALRSMIADPSTSESDRRQAINSLAGLGPPYRDQAATALRSIIADPSTSASERRDTIKSLAGLDPQYRDQEVAALQDVIANPSAWERRHTIKSMTGLDPQYRDQAAAALRDVIADPSTSAWERRAAAESLAGLDPQYRDQAAAALRDVIADPSTNAWERRAAAESLAGLDPQHRDQAAAALRDVIANPSTSASERRAAAESLAGLDPPDRDQAAAALRDVIANPSTSASKRRDAAESLAGLDPQHRDQAAAALRDVIADPSTETYDRRDAIKLLAGLGPQYRERVAIALRGIIASRRTGASDRRQAAELLADLDPQYVDEAVAALRGIIASRRTGASDRRQAAELLADLDTQYVDEALAALRGIIASRRTGASDRRQAAELLAELPQYHEEAVAALRRVLADRRADAYDQWQAIKSLAGLDFQYHDEAGTAVRRIVREIIVDPSISTSDGASGKSNGRQAIDRRDVSLAGLGPPYRDEAATALRDVIADPSTSASGRWQAAKLLAGLGPPYRDEAASALRDVIADPSIRTYDREQAIKSLARLDAQYREKAAIALRRVFASHSTETYSRQAEAELLAGLGPPYRDEAAAALRGIMADPDTSAYSRQAAIKALAGLGPPYRDEAAAALRGIMADPDTSAYSRQAAIKALAGLGPPYRDEAAAALRGIMADPDTSASDRRQAAESFAWLGVSSKPEPTVADSKNVTVQGRLGGWIKKMRGSRH